MNRINRDWERNLIERFDDLVREVGGDPDTVSGKLVREMVHTSIKLLRDGADTGELKLTSRSLKELRYAMKVFRDYRDVRKVSIFGSARTAEDHPNYQAAVTFSQKMAQNGWMVITGGGGGIMRAGHGGAGRRASFGVAIRLPFETTANEFIAGDPKLIVFRYFFTRKLMFASQAGAVALFPGGFGTQDECFEILTLIQTGKSPIVPVVMIDPPGSSYWKNWDRYVRNELLPNELINAEDLNLYQIVAVVDDAVDHIQHFYRNYHSQRFVRDDLVIRLNRTLTEAQIEAINNDFADLVAEGRIDQSDPDRSERRHLELPRLRFFFTRRKYGRLRLLIDRINDFDAENHPQLASRAAMTPQ